MKANCLRRFLLLITFFLTGVGPFVQAQLGANREEWKVKFGTPDAKGIYRWEYKPEVLFEAIPKWQDDRVVAISLRKADGHPLSNGMSRALVYELRVDGARKEEKTEYELSEDRKVLLFRFDFPEAPPKLTMTALPRPVLGLTTSEWQEKFGKPNEEGVYVYDGYRIKPQLGLKNGKISWIRIRKESGERLGQAEQQTLFTSLTGKPKENFSPEKFVFDDGKTLIVSKGK